MNSIVSIFRLAILGLVIAVPVLVVLAATGARRREGRILLLGHSAGGGLLVRYAGGGRGPAADGYVLLAPYLGPAAPTTKPDAGGWARPDIPAITALVAKAAQGDT